ncbi:MAG TPA: hypothetical protein VMR62_34465, partial [Bryobacteraceae bacterium]|nr:hypothetical protein [Bryobacteraceae bacterium]
MTQFMGSYTTTQTIGTLTNILATGTALADLVRRGGAFPVRQLQVRGSVQKGEGPMSLLSFVLS